MNWKKRGLSLLLIAWLGCWLGPAPAGGQTAEVDSLVWYAEQLEFDLRICEIRGDARADSLAVVVQGLEERLVWAKEDRQRWYHDPRLWFLFGAVSSALVMAGALQISF